MNCFVLFPVRQSLYKFQSVPIWSASELFMSPVLFENMDSSSQLFIATISSIWYESDYIFFCI